MIQNRQQNELLVQFKPLLDITTFLSENLSYRIISLKLTSLEMSNVPSLRN